MGIQEQLSQMKMNDGIVKHDGSSRLNTYDLEMHEAQQGILNCYIER